MTDSVSRATMPRSKPEMNAIGYLMIACLLLFLFPLIPLIAVVAGSIYVLRRLRGGSGAD